MPRAFRLHFRARIANFATVMVVLPLPGQAETSWVVRAVRKVRRDWSSGRSFINWLTQSMSASVTGEIRSAGVFMRWFQLRGEAAGAGWWHTEWRP